MNTVLTNILARKTLSTEMTGSSTDLLQNRGPLSKSALREVFQDAVAAAKAGDREAARRLFQRVTEGQPGIPQAWLWRAHLAAEPREKIDYLRRARRLDPENSKTRGALMTALMETGIACAKSSKKPEARRFLSEATQLDGRLEAAWMWLASLAETSPEKLRNVEKVLAINPRQPQALAWLAELEKEGATRVSMAATVLVVDDSLTVRSLVNRTLTRRGCRVLMAADGASALQLLEQHKPDLIFLDIDLPDTDGFEVCQRIKSRSDTRDVPIVMLSGKDSEVDKERGKSLGAEDHISKPFRPADLEKALRRFRP